MGFEGERGGCQVEERQFLGVKMELVGQIVAVFFPLRQ
jgi:hypothetical protein